MRVKLSISSGSGKSVLHVELVVISAKSTLQVSHCLVEEEDLVRAFLYSELGRGDLLLLLAPIFCLFSVLLLLLLQDYQHSSNFCI